MARVTKQQQQGPKRAAIYPRVSTRGQEEEGTSLTTQEQQCREYALKHGYVVDESHVYREVHTGTELWERPQLARMREAVRLREVDVVIAYAIDRLSRDPVHLGVLLTEAEHAGIAVEFVTEPLDHSPEGQLIRFVRGYAAKVEHEKIKERSMRGKLARVASGKLIPSYRPLYGYRWNDDRTALLPDDTTAPVVARMFREAARGRSVRQIAASLIADGIPRPSGADAQGENATRWGERTIWLILTNPAYAGAPQAFRFAKTTSSVALPEGVCPPLVEPATFEAVQVRRGQNRITSIRNNRHPEESLLRGGYAHCGFCGWTLHVCRPGS